MEQCIHHETSVERPRLFNKVQEMALGMGLNSAAWNHRPSAAFSFLPQLGPFKEITGDAHTPPPR